jgi:two-component system, OmpR family, sensor histidine kinase KdpD
LNPFFLLFGAAMAVAAVSSRAREQAKAAQEIVALMQFSRALNEASGEDAIAGLLCGELRRRCAVHVSFYLGTEATERAADSRYPLVTREGEPLGVVLIHERLSNSRRRVAEALIMQTGLALERERLAQRAQEIELFKASEQLQATLLHSISHDMRSPLVAIKGTLQSLLVEETYPLQADDRQLLLSNALQETERLNRFVANMLQMTRLESGHLELRLEPQDLRDVVHATLELLRHPPRIELRLPAHIPPVQADSVLLQQTLWNLLENALKFAPSGFIEIGADVREKTVELWVRDFGPGIPESERHLIYNRFYRGTTEIKGSGLGLPICHGLMQAMGGSIQMEDAAPGARFRLSLRTADL